MKTVAGDDMLEVLNNLRIRSVPERLEFKYASEFSAVRKELKEIKRVFFHRRC